MLAPIISVTGTKGKTTTVSVIADVVQQLGYRTLKVDTTGHFVDGVRKSTLDDSKKLWDLVPSVSPGRYLYEFHGSEHDKDMAVLECSLGCSSLPGLGYGHHNVGVFLNVFEDHLGSSDRLVTKEDIATAKQFVFERLRKDNGYAVFNADDELVCSKISKIPPTCHLIPFGTEFSCFDLDKHLNQGGLAVAMQGTDIVLRSKTEQTVLADLRQIPWTFNGTFMPSNLNMMAAVAAVIAVNGGIVPDHLRDILEAVRLDPNGGRLTVLKNKAGVTVLADYAHEKQSLSLVGDLARNLVHDNGKVTGVVRLAHDRTDELMKETAHQIASHFDGFVVYDKIDGHFRSPSDRIRRFPEVIGRTSTVFSQALSEKCDDVTRIVREDEAIAHAAQKAKPGDVVVVIINDDIKRSIEFIKKSFDAELV